VPVPDFFFALEVDAQSGAGRLSGELASRLLQYAADAAAFVFPAGEQIAQAVAAAGTRCLVQFRAADGTLEIVVRSSGREIWRAAHPLP
jgi:hypothetical protein